MIQGFSPVYSLPTFEEQTLDEEEHVSNAPTQIVSDIYFNVDVHGMQEVTKELLELDYDIDPNTYQRIWGRYTDGRFGIADVIIMQISYGQEENAMNAMQTIRANRINQFQNYDIYNSYNIATQGVILERSDYYILLMIDDLAMATAIVDKYIPR